ncbi:MAG: ABC transporter permease [Candidatus Acidiferrales bacterium]
MRYGWRMLGKAPGFTALAILTLALGIGANTSIFTVANSVILRPLPYKNPGELVRISTVPDGTCCVSLPYFTLLSENNRSLSGVTAYVFESVNLARPNGAEQVDAERVTWNFFDVLRVKPLAGRTFTAEEDQPGGVSVVLIGYQLAQRLFGGAQNALGQHLALDSKDYAIIGVLPAKFGLQLFGRQPEIWMTRIVDFSMTTPARVNLGGMYYEAIGRLRPGTTPAQASAETEVIFQQYKNDKPDNFDASSDFRVSATDLQDNLVADARPTLLILAAAVGFVFLIACANVASLLLSRALGRGREFAIRSALGAPRSAVIRLVLIESMLMALLSGGLGILFSYEGTKILAAFMQPNLPQVANVPIDLRVLAFALGISMLSGILFGSAPAMQLSQRDLASTLCEEGRGTAGSRRRNRTRSIIVTAQIALSMILLIGSGLLIRSFVRLRNVHPGFDPRNVLTAQMFLPLTSYPHASDRITFYENVLRQLQTTPGVQSVAISTGLPTHENHATPARFEGQPQVQLGQEPIVLIESISPDYAETLRVPLLQGRAFSDSDDAQAAGVVMVNRALASKFWPDEDPIGKLVWIGTLQARKVVGVIGDVKNRSLAERTEPEVFLPYPQLASATIYLSVRTVVEPNSLVPVLRSKIVGVNAGQPISDVQTMDERLAVSSAQARSLTVLIGVFSATALILAVVGIYGVIAYSVAQRTQEMGVRIALGASNAKILKLVIGDGLKLAVAGIVVGIAASLALTQLLANQLFATSATDPLTFAGSVVLFLVVALLASYFPARRATRISPTDALRSI